VRLAVSVVHTAEAAGHEGSAAVVPQLVCTGACAAAQANEATNAVEPIRTWMACDNDFGDNKA
jgi:hypothetical protein